jgi:hypothetical protein
LKTHYVFKGRKEMPSTPTGACACTRAHTRAHILIYCFWQTSFKHVLNSFVQKGNMCKFTLSKNVIFYPLQLLLKLCDEYSESEIRRNECTECFITLLWIIMPWKYTYLPLNNLFLFSNSSICKKLSFFFYFFNMHTQAFHEIINCEVS